MSLCINPNCPKPDDPDNARNRFCESCGSDLLIQGRYRVMRLLSDKSGFGKIYEASEGGTPKILKVLKENLNSDAKAVELFKQEAEVLGQLPHPGIPDVDGYFPYRSRTGIPLHCIVMEKIEGSNLEEWMEARGNQPISEQQAIAWLKQLAVLLKLVHDKQYLHRDIKPSNVMLRTPPQSPPYQGGAAGSQSPPYKGGVVGGQLVLIDFGTAREVTRTYLAKIGSGQGITAIVSSGYTAPEQANGEARAQSDFYSLGRTFVFLLTGRYPNTMYDARTDELNWRSHTSGISLGLLNLIDWLMASNPHQRPANAQQILQRLEELERQPGVSSAETVNVVGALIPPQPLPPQETTLPPQVTPAPQQDSGKLPLLAFLTFLLVGFGLLSLAAAVMLNSDSTSSTSVRRSWPKNAQIPQEKGDVDYFPYVEGTDSQGRTAEFNVAVLSREYKWQFSSSYQVKHNDRLIPLDALKSELEDEGIQRIMENPSQIISVGTASCEGSQNQEERRAFERAKQIQLLGKKLFSSVPSVRNYRLLNLGQFRGESCNSNQDETSYQRSVIIIGVKQETPGVVLDEALRSRLIKKPFGDFQIDDYSLGSADRFKTIPSNLE